MIQGLTTIQSQMFVKNLVKQAIQQLTLGRFVYRYPVTDRVFLTFDDGPDEEFTPQILSILKEFGQKGTFFLIGKHVDKYSELALETSSAGHCLGLHTYTHTTLDKMSREGFREEINCNQKSIQQAIGKAPTLLRPPKGRIQLKNLFWAAQLQLQVVHYTITSNDWKAESIDNVLECVKINEIQGGEIISFHDNNKHTVEALPIILEELAKKGMSCDTIPCGE